MAQRCAAAQAENVPSLGAAAHALTTTSLTSKMSELQILHVLVVKNIKIQFHFLLLPIHFNFGHTFPFVAPINQKASSISPCSSAIRRTFVPSDFKWTGSGVEEPKLNTNTSEKNTSCESQVT